MKRGWRRARAIEMEKLPAVTGAVFFLEENRGGDRRMQTGCIHQGAAHLPVGQTPFARMVRQVLRDIGMMLAVRPLAIQKRHNQQQGKAAKIESFWITR